MRLADRRWWIWTVWMLILGSIVMLWKFTALDDAESALWRHYTVTTAIVNVGCSAVLLGIGYVMTAGGGIALRLARVTAVALSVVGTLGVLELPTAFGHDYGLMFHSHTNDPWVQLSTGINRVDEELIHVHRPHSQFRGTVRGNLARLGLPFPARYQVDLAYDRNGFRNDGDFTQADLVAIGDSFVEAAEVARDQTVVAELGRLLGVRAANLGQSGYGPQQELIVLKRYGVPLSPKAVVWFLFGGNDLSDIDVYEWRRNHLAEFLAPPSFGARSFARNALTALARITTPSRQTPSAIARRHEIQFTRRDGSIEVLYLDADEGAWEPRQWEALSRILPNARDVAANMRASFLVVYIPRKLRVYQGFLRSAPGAFARTWRPNNLSDEIASFCEAHAIAFLDSTTALREAVASGESVYLPDDVHWNAAGHRTVAAAVASQLQQMGIGTNVPAGAER